MTMPGDERASGWQAEPLFNDSIDYERALKHARWLLTSRGGTALRNLAHAYIVLHATLNTKEPLP